MVLALCATGFVTAVDAAGSHEETGVIMQDDFLIHEFDIPAGPEVKIELIWDEPGDVIDLDFYELPDGVSGATLQNPEIGFLSGITDPTHLVIGIHGYWVPGDGVEYCLRITYGSDVIPEPYAESGGLTVGDLTSWHHAARLGIYSASYKSAHSYVYQSNPWRQTIMPWYSWIGNMYEGSGWAGPAFYAGDALLVGGLTIYWPMDEYTLKEAREELEETTVIYKVDGILLEDLGHATEGPIRTDNFNHQWYWRLPAVIFKPGELFDALNQPVEYLHSFEYSVPEAGWYFYGNFYLVW